MALGNWAGNHAYRARAVHRPTTLEQLRELVARAPRIRALGTRHSFSDIADSDELVSLEALGGGAPGARLAVDPAARTVSLNPAITYSALANALAPHGLALANMASLPHISVAGAVATATHGSGDRNGNLATAVRELQLVRSDGELVTIRRGEPEFEGAVVGLGALGVVTRITLALEPAYEVAQRVFEDLTWDALSEHFDEITAAGYSVSVFHRLGPRADQVWVKRRLDAERAEPPLGEELFGARAATVERHPILGLDPVHATPQLGAPGPWSERLPHFRSGFTPSSGAELQSEYLLGRGSAVEAIDRVRARAAKLAPLIQVSEIRTVAADRLWMSPQYDRDTVALHFTWVADQPAVERALPGLEAALLALGARPHWGKLFAAGADAIAERYPRHREFAALIERLDPRQAFRNDWLAERVLGL
jgi:alditol oxidase